MTQSNKKPNKGGAPPGNRNATKHGLRGSGLPPGCSYIEGQIYSFKRYIREELGEMSLWQQAQLQSACRHEQRALLAARWLRLEAENLKVAERATLLKTISDATDARDRCLRAIGVDKPPDEWDSLYSPPRVDDRSIDQANQNATDGQPEPQNVQGDDHAESK